MEEDVTNYFSDRLAVDITSTAVKSPRQLPVGVLTPTKAAALRRERVALATDGGAVPTPPCRPNGSAPTTSNGRGPTLRGWCSAQRHVNRSTSPTCSLDTSWRYSYYASGAYPPARRASPPHAKGSESAAKGGTRGGDRGRDGAMEGAAPPLAIPRREHTLTAQGCVPATSVGSDRTDSNSKCIHSKDARTMQYLQSFFNQLEQRPGVAPMSTLFNYGVCTSLMGSSLKRQNSTSRSLMYDVLSATSCNVRPSTSKYESTTVPRQEEGAEDLDRLISMLLHPDPVVRLMDENEARDDAWEDMDKEVHVYCSSKKGRADLKKAFSFFCDATGAPGLLSCATQEAEEPGLQRTHTLFTRTFTSLAKEANTAREMHAAVLGSMAASAAALDLSGAVLRAPSIFISATLPGDALEVQDLYSDDGSENGTEAMEEGGAKQQAAPPPPGGAGLTPCPPPVASVDGASRRLRPATSPVVPPTARDACIPPRPVPVLHSPLTLDAELLRPARHPTSTGRTSPRAAKPLRMRYLCPQPEMAGPPLPPLSKADPRRLFGGNCLADAPWVSSPRDADADKDISTTLSSEDAPIIPAVPKNKREMQRDNKKSVRKAHHRSPGGCHPKSKEKKHGAIIGYFIRKLQKLT
ncbi:hypothetical protein STCU_10029 [Strigomonas culicis]|uniref:Uncharacterized protein n=1 Tax=Strigomonas culicis TaxID=28005 RepID=S9TJP5_9TRYP|nr:hypothetical protein STCU_10029 [Strigomonas culicis]|eukprot:EPY18347.1 hypothetical protein STCU_10029 [Strigomonas culicis]